MDWLLRFVIGGVAVSLFAVLGDVFKPKSFAGLFGAAPSVAIATLVLAFFQHDANYVAAQGLAMTIGAAALAIYCLIVRQLLVRLQLSSLVSAGTALIAWAGIAFGLKSLLIG